MTTPFSHKIRDSLLNTEVIGASGTRFFVRAVLGEGGQGWVYRANYADPDGMWVVVKLLRPEGITQDTLSRFERETRVLQMLGASNTPNPNIIRFFDHGVHSLRNAGLELALPFIALELVDGPTLGEVIDQHPSGLGVDRATRLMRQVARALHTVHGHNIVHRDLKPSNIMLASQQGIEVAKVTDFGLVKAPQLSSRATTTIAGASLGYAPPEQYEMGNSRVSPKTDVFSFATILFEVLSGHRAFPHISGDNPLLTVARIMSGDRPKLVRHLATLPEALRARPDVVDAIDVHLARATAGDMEGRPDSVMDLWNEVEPMLRGLLERPSNDVIELSHSIPTVDRVKRLEFTEICGPLGRDRLRTGVVAADEGAIYATGMNGLYRSFRGHWAEFARPAWVDPRRVRGLSRTKSGELLVFGEGGLSAILLPGGTARPLAGAGGDFNWLGAFTEDGDIVLCGERRSRPQGVVAEITESGAHVHNVTATSRLFAVTRLASGALLACGAHGDLVEIVSGEQRPVPWGRTGHLYACARSPDGGALAVGSGGHALCVDREDGGPLRATLEAVQTTRDLWTLRVAKDGSAWAAGSQARLLERRKKTWVRVALDASVGDLIALGTNGETVSVLAEDGKVLEGRYVF